MNNDSASIVAPVLGRVIKLARTDSGITQTELAKKVGTNQSTVSSWESGRQRPKLTQIEPLAQALGIQRDSLLEAVACELAIADDRDESSVTEIISAAQ